MADIKLTTKGSLIKRGAHTFSQPAIIPTAKTAEEKKCESVSTTTQGSSNRPLKTEEPKLNIEKTVEKKSTIQSDRKSINFSQEEINLLLNCVSTAAQEGFYLMYELSDDEQINLSETLTAVLLKLGVESEDIAKVSNGYAE